MLLPNKTAIVYGGGGAIGGAVAQAFAREGAQVFLAGRTLKKMQAVAEQISAKGGEVEVQVLDALEEEAVNHHAESVVKKTGRIDIALNAVGIFHVQGSSFLDLSFQDYELPIHAYTKTNFLTAKAVSPYMVKQGSGVILTLSTPGARLSGSGFLGNGVSSAAVEAFSRILAGELGPSGIRVVCLRSDAIPEAVSQSHTQKVFQSAADQAGITIEAMLAARADQATLLKRLPTLAQIADVAAFVASSQAGAMTGAIVNLTCGSLVD